MLVSKKKYDFLLARYEQAASRADLLERQQAELNGALKAGAKIPPVYGFSGFSECDPNRQLDVSGGKRHAACRF